MNSNKHAIQFVKVLRVKCGSYRKMYTLLYGKEPSQKDVKNLTNYVNRGNYNTQFLVNLIDAFELENVTLGEIFKGTTKN